MGRVKEKERKRKTERKEDIMKRGKNKKNELMKGNNKGGRRKLEFEDKMKENRRQSEYFIKYSFFYMSHSTQFHQGFSTNFQNFIICFVSMREVNSENDSIILIILTLWPFRVLRNFQNYQLFEGFFSNFGCLHFEIITSLNKVVFIYFHPKVF